MWCSHDYDRATWYLHRKLFHRFLKYAKYFRKATEQLPEFVQGRQDEQVALLKQKKREDTAVAMTPIVNLITSSSEEVSEDEESNQPQAQVSEVFVFTCDVHMWCSHVMFT